MKQKSVRVYKNQKINTEDKIDLPYRQLLSIGEQKIGKIRDVLGWCTIMV